MNIPIDIGRGFLYISKLQEKFQRINWRRSPTIDPRAATKLQSELLSGETLRWAAMPDRRVVFHSDDWFTIPFSLLWGGFAIFWEAGVLGYWADGRRAHPAPGFFALWGIPFVIFGQYFIWGRFLMDAWLKRRTYYGLTEQRVLILQEGWKRKTRTCYLEAIPEVVREGENCGTLWLGQKLPTIGSRRSPKQSVSRFDVDSVVPLLADIDELDSVHRLILELREQASKPRKLGKQILSYREQN